MVCPRCRIARLVEISMKVADRSVVMRSCSECGTRWQDGSEALDLPGVLKLVAASR